jgi:hypothetical protein
MRANRISLYFCCSRAVAVEDTICPVALSEKCLGTEVPVDCKSVRTGLMLSQASTKLIASLGRAMGVYPKTSESRFCCYDSRFAVDSGRRAQPPSAKIISFLAENWPIQARQPNDLRTSLRNGFWRMPFRLVWPYLHRYPTFAQSPPTIALLSAGGRFGTR